MSNIAEISKAIRLTLTFSMIGYVLLTLAGMMGLHNWYYGVHDIAFLIAIIVIVIVIVLTKIEKKYENNNRS